MRLDDAFRKSLLRWPGNVNRPRKTTSTAPADFKCIIVFYDMERIMRNDVGDGGRGGGV